MEILMIEILMMEILMMMMGILRSIDGSLTDYEHADEDPQIFAQSSAQIRITLCKNVHNLMKKRANVIPGFTILPVISMP